MFEVNRRQHELPQYLKRKQPRRNYSQGPQVCANPGEEEPTVCIKIKPKTNSKITSIVRGLFLPSEKTR